MKRIFSIFVAVMLVLSMTVTSFAAGETNDDPIDMAVEYGMMVDAGTYWLTYTAAEDCSISFTSSVAYTLADADGNEIAVEESVDGWWTEYCASIDVATGETVLVAMTTYEMNYYGWTVNIPGMTPDAPIMLEELGTYTYSVNTYNGMFFQYIPEVSGEIIVTIDTESAANGWQYRFGNINEWGEPDTIITNDNDESNDYTGEWYINGHDATTTVNAVAGTPVVLQLMSNDEADGEARHNVTFTLSAGQVSEGGDVVEPVEEAIDIALSYGEELFEGSHDLIYTATENCSILINSSYASFALSYTDGDEITVEATAHPMTGMPIYSATVNVAAGETVKLTLTTEVPDLFSWMVSPISDGGDEGGDEGGEDLPVNTFDLNDPMTAGGMLTTDEYTLIYTADENVTINVSSMSGTSFTLAYADGTPIEVVCEDNPFWGPSYSAAVDVAAGESVELKLTPSADDYYSFAAVVEGTMADAPIVIDAFGTYTFKADLWTCKYIQFIPAVDGNITLTIDTAASVNGWKYKFGNDDGYGCANTTLTNDSDASNDEAGEWYSNGSSPVTVIAAVAGQPVVIELNSYNPDDEITSYPVTFTLSEGGEIDNGGNEGGGEGGDDIVAGSDANNPIVYSEDSFAVTVPAGETVWYAYDNWFLPMLAVYNQNLNVVSAAEAFAVSYGVMDAETGAPNVIDSDADGFVNVKMDDRTGMGKYIFAITNNSEYDETFYVTFTDVPTYILTEINLELGDNTITLDTSAPTIIYNFNTGDINIYAVDENGDIIFDDNGDVVIAETIVGPGPGEYIITVKDTEGNVIESALLGNWGTVGYPFDMTGEDKTNTFTWQTTEENASLLLGVSEIFEDSFIINIERVGDYDDGKEKFVYEDYEIKHFPDADFEMPDGELTKVDITVPQTVVLGADGYYHINSVTGPIVYVDMTLLYNAYYPADGGQPAITLRGKYIGEDGKEYGYDFKNAMLIYADALCDGFYPLTVDLANYINIYGAAQGWFMEGLSPFEEINNGEFIAESAWLATAYYIEGADVGFIDVDDNAWYKPYVDYVVENNLMVGTGNGSTFEPDTVATRAMFVTILYRMAGSPAVVSENPFTDVAANAWYYNAVIWAYENNIVAGTSTGDVKTFSPNGKVTREQVARLLRGYAEKWLEMDVNADDCLDFVDAGSVSSWATADVNWAVSIGIISGKLGNDGVTRLAPKDSADRAQIASIFARFNEMMKAE